MDMNLDIRTQLREQLEEEAVLTTEHIDQSAKVIVFNDEINTFDWVIESFVEVCRHSLAQAEQLSYIIHFNGKATVKTGDRQALRPIKDALIDRGLSAVLED